MSQNQSLLVRLLPGALGLLCAALLTVSLVTCSGMADRTLSDWVPSDDYGTRDYQTYTLTSEDEPMASALSVTPPDWVIGVATDSAPSQDPAHSLTHLTYSFATGNVVLTYATDNVDDFMAWQLNEDTIITSHLFGGRYTNIQVGTPQQATWGGRTVTWGTYSFDDEYGRTNRCYVSATPITNTQVLTLVATETLAEQDDAPFLDEAVLQDLWSGIA